MKNNRHHINKNMKGNTSPTVKIKSILTNLYKYDSKPTVRILYAEEVVSCIFTVGIAKRNIR